jgi:hypothetical protein
VLKALPGRPATVTIQTLAAGTYTLTAGGQKARLVVSDGP